MKYSILFALLLAVCTQVSSAQPQELTKAEYVLLAYGALAKTEKVPRRVARTYIYQNGAEVGDIVSETVEYEPMMHKHSITFRKTSKGEIREEILEADGRQFVRKGAGKWKEKKDGYVTSTTITGTGSTAADANNEKSQQQETQIFRRIGSEVVGGQETQVIEKIWIIVETRGWSKRVSEFHERLWIQSDGRIKKEQLRSTEGGKEWSHSVSVYEYDPTIKIEVPIRYGRPRQ